MATLEPTTAAAIMAMVAESPEALARRLEVEREQAAIQAEVLRRPESTHLAGWGVTAVRHATEVQVSAELRRDLVTGAGQPFRCYERALWYLLRHADAPGIQLVHGIVVEGEPARAWSHAWAEIGGTVYDPTPGRHFERASWYQALRAVRLVAYTPSQAAARCLQEGPPGPWGEHDVIHQALIDDRLAELAAEHPDLITWLRAMLEQDLSFAGQVAAIVEPNPLRWVHLLETYAVRPELWRSHRPGEHYPLKVFEVG